MCVSITLWCAPAALPGRDPTIDPSQMAPPLIFFSSSGGDGEFIHMDDSGAMLLGLRVNESALVCFIYSYLWRNWDLLCAHLDYNRRKSSSW